MKAIFLLSLTLVLFSSIGHAQRPLPQNSARIFPAELHPALPKAIFVGQSVFDAQTALKAQNIQSSDLAKPFPRLNADLSALAFTIDLDNVGAYVFYNKTTQKVVGLTIVFKPFGDADKSAEAYVEAEQLNWYADRTYSITFSAPAEPKYSKMNVAGLPGQKDPAVLYPGQAIAEAERTLKEQLHLEYGSGRRAIQKPPADQAEYSFNFDETQIRGTVHYSKTTNKVLSLIVSFRPSNSQLSDETDMSVLSWNIHPNSSYSIRFNAPLTRAEYEELVRKRANTQGEFPTRPMP